MTEISQHVQLPAEVIQEDQRLDAEASRANVALAELRWHWTADEANPDRVGVREYGRAVGRHHRAISMMVRGYVAWRDNLSTHGAPGRAEMTLQDSIQLEMVRDEDQQIVLALAHATNMSVVNTRQHYKTDVDRIRIAVADARDSEDDFTPEREQEVIEHQATLIAAGRQAERARREQRQRSAPAVMLVVEGDLQHARRSLTKALEDAQLLDLSANPDLIAGLRDVIGKVVALAQLVQSALGGQTDIDWDAELAKITGK